MPKKAKTGSKRKLSAKTKLVRDLRKKVKETKKNLRELERDLRSFTGRRKRSS